MEPILSDEQRLLADSVGKLLTQAGGVKRTRAVRGKSGGFDRAVHARMADEGWFGLLVPVDKGGLGLGPTELALVALEAGRVLAPEPIAATALSAYAVAQGGSSGPGSELLAGMLEGRAIVMPAMSDGADPTESAAGSVAATGKAGAVQLQGRCDSVPMAGACDGFLVAARRTGAARMLVYVPRPVKGLSISSRDTVDGRPLADLRLENVEAALVVSTDAKALLALYDLQLLAVAAELTGVMSAVLDITVEYLKTRRQFGKPIGSFQALQHRAVDDFTRITSTRSLLFQVAAQGPAPSSAMASALLSHASGCALAVTKSAIQMHGAIGFTEECDVGLYLKRAMYLSAAYGNSAHHRRRYARAFAALD